MTRKEKEYRRLPGRGMRRQGMVSAVRVISTVWLGKDHLLCIDSTGGYAEDYKRFYFRDIEAIIVRKTDRWHFSSLILGTLFLVPALIGLGVSGIGWRIFWFVFAGTFFLLFAPNWLRGPTCVCHLRTAVQTEELPSLRRLRTARKVIGIVKPLIEQAQGTVAPEEVHAKLQETLTRSLDRSPSPAAGPSTAAGAVAGLRQASPLSTYNGRMHAGLFTLLMVDAPRGRVDFFVNNLLIAAVEVLLWSGIGVSVIM